MSTVAQGSAEELHKDSLGSCIRTCWGFVQGLAGELYKYSNQASYEEPVSAEDSAEEQGRLLGNQMRTQDNPCDL